MHAWNCKSDWEFSDSEKDWVLLAAGPGLPAGVSSQRRRQQCYAKMRSIAKAMRTSSGAPYEQIANSFRPMRVFIAPWNTMASCLTMRRLSKILQNFDFVRLMPGLRRVASSVRSLR